MEYKSLDGSERQGYTFVAASVLGFFVWEFLIFPSVGTGLGALFTLAVTVLVVFSILESLTKKQ